MLRHVGHNVMTRTVNPCGRRAAAKVKIRMSRIAMRPAAGRWFERPNFCGSCQARIGEGLFRCRCRLKFRCRCRLDEERSWRLGFAAAVCPSGRGGDLVDLVGRDCLSGQQAKYDGNGSWDTTITMLPASHAPGTDVEPPGNTVLRDAECVERFAKLNY